MNGSLNGPCNFFMLALLVMFFTWPMAAFYGNFIYGPWLWPSMHVSLPLLPFDGLLQHIRELVHPAEGRHALFRSQATARAGCLSSMTFTEDKILCSQFMLWHIPKAWALLSDTCVAIMHSMNTPCISSLTKPSNLARGVAQLLEGLLKERAILCMHNKWANIMLHKFTKHVETQPIHSHAYTWFCWASLAKHASSINSTLVYLNMCV